MKLNQEAVKRLQNCNWLENCGSKEVWPSFPCEFFQEKDHFLEKLKSTRYVNTLLEHQNDLTSFLFRNHRDVYNLFWNEMVDEIKKNVLPEIEAKVIAQLDRLEIPQSEEVWDNMNIGITGILLALSYEEYYHSELYHQLLEIYEKGHLPCGWRGKIYKGCFLVY